MKKLIGKIKCYFGSHDWGEAQGLGEWLEKRRCKRCGLFWEADTLLNNNRYYYLTYP